MPAASTASGLVERPNSLAGSGCHFSVQAGHKDSRYLTSNLFSQHKLKGLERLPGGVKFLQRYPVFQTPTPATPITGPSNPEAATIRGPSHMHTHLAQLRNFWNKVQPSQPDLERATISTPWKPCLFSWFQSERTHWAAEGLGSSSTSPTPIWPVLDGC